MGLEKIILAYESALVRSTFTKHANETKCVALVLGPCVRRSESPGTAVLYVGSVVSCGIREYVVSSNLLVVPLNFWLSGFTRALYMGGDLAGVSWFVPWK